MKIMRIFAHIINILTFGSQQNISVREYAILADFGKV